MAANSTPGIPPAERLAELEEQLKNEQQVIDEGITPYQAHHIAQRDKLRLEIKTYKQCLADLKGLRNAAEQAREAFRLTREYVGEDLLPAIEGWSWYDADQALAARLAEWPEQK